jgi:pimeloyl-ACP methyl ester carboxylesterase
MRGVGELVLILMFTYVLSRNVTQKTFLERIGKIEPVHIMQKLELLEDYDESQDVLKSFEEIVTKKGYPLSTYYVTTEDGYILKVYRIEGPKNTYPNTTNIDPSKRVVLLQHGVFDSSDSWVANYENKSLAFVLANKGYDVWLGNNRGNKYSRAHRTLNPNKDADFWKFSFHEMGLYDLPAMINFIKSHTGREKISYIGHSQGTAQLFAAMTLQPEYFTANLNSFLAFGPITNLTNIGSTFLKILADYKIDILLSKLRIHEIFENKNAVDRFEVITCKYIGILCTDVLNMLADANPKYDDMDRFLVFISHFPSGTSIQAVEHFGDDVRNKRFSLYNSDVAYNLDNIKNIPIGLFVGDEDLLATVKDNRYLNAYLSKNSVIKFYKEYEGFGHASFFLSKSNEHIQDVLDFLEKYSK